MANVPSGIGALSGYGMPAIGATGGGTGSGALQSQVIDHLLKAQLTPLPGVPGRPLSYAPFEQGAPLTRTIGLGGVINPVGPSDLTLPGLQAFPGAPGGYSSLTRRIAGVPASVGAGEGGVTIRPALPRSGGKGAML